MYIVAGVAFPSSFYHTIMSVLKPVQAETPDEDDDSLPDLISEYDSSDEEDDAPRSRPAAQRSNIFSQFEREYVHRPQPTYTSRTGAAAAVRRRTTPVTDAYVPIARGLSYAVMLQARRDFEALVRHVVHSRLPV